jgi:hypothetical protein
MSIQPNGGQISFPFGNVGIGGTFAPIAKLDARGGSGTGVYGESAATNTASQAGVYGKGTGSGGIGVVGEANVANAVGVLGVSSSQGGVGLYARNTGGGYGIYSENNVGQNRDMGGFVKAMIYVQQDGTILRCFNGLTNVSTGNCGFSVISNFNGKYLVNFNFQVDDRFISLTARNPDAFFVHVGATFQFPFGEPNKVKVQTFITHIETLGDDANFMIFIY